MAIYCFDLDGTLCETKYADGRHYYKEAQPIPARIQAVNRLYNQGNIIIIETSRGSGSGVNWFQDTVKQLVSWGLRFHTVRTGIKYAADYYVDDKAVNAQAFFNGLV